MRFASPNTCAPARRPIRRAAGRRFVARFARPTRGRGAARAFTLIELMVVMALVSTLMLLIAATIWGAVRIEQTDAAVMHRIMAQGRLADQFRRDVHRATDWPDSFREHVAGGDCLILRIDEGHHVVYYNEAGRLARVEQLEPDATPAPTRMPVGGDYSAQFVRSQTGPRVATMQLIGRQGPANHARRVEISAALGGTER